MRMLNALITATCGNDVVVALGSGPFFGLFWLCFVLCVFVDCVGQYAFLAGGNAFLPNADVVWLLLAAALCTV